MAKEPISNSDEVIDSRDVIGRIEELEAELEDAPEEGEEADEFSDQRAELAILKALAAEAEGYASDWSYGETLIRDSYFKDYAQELADDIGAIDSNAKWPANHIDWEAAAAELQQDYTQVDFDGVAYWIR